VAGNLQAQGSIGLRTILVTIFIVLGLLFAWEIRGTLMLAFAAVVLVVLFAMPVRLLVTSLTVNRILAIILSVVGFFVLLLLFGFWVLPTIGAEFAQLVPIVETGVQQLIDRIDRDALILQYPWLEGALEGLGESDELINQLVTQLSEALGQLGGTVLPVVGGVANTILSALIIVFLSLYLLAEPDLYAQGLLKLTPVWYRARMQVILARIESTLRAWLSVTGVSMALVALLTGLGLAVLGIKQWLALGVLAGVLSFVPNFGPVIALIPSVAVAIVQVPQHVLWTVVVIYGVSIVQSQVISPVLASERMQLPAITILLGQIIFGFFFGFLGLMLAVPLSACVAVLVDEIYVKDILGDRERSQAVQASAPAENLAEDSLPPPPKLVQN